MPASPFENKPEHCPFDHELWLGKAQVSCEALHLCAGSGQVSGRDHGMGHVRLDTSASRQAWTVVLWSQDLTDRR